MYMDGILDNPNGAGPTIAKFTIWPGGSSPQWMNLNNILVSLTAATIDGASAYRR
ncbi:hypothetical protein AGMMS49992_19190 [Clostridia bacterium]|nr:hypothetical protein AGMMS49992_19190 [Clostridia bacterium]